MLCGGAVFYVEVPREPVHDELGAVADGVIERAVDEVLLFDAFDVVEEDLLHGGHGEFAFEPREGDVCQVVSPHFFVVWFEVELV